MKWGGRDFAGRVFHVHELYDWASDERLAWAFAIPGEGFLDVEELFVRPQYRCRGYGSHLLKSLHRLSRMAQLHLRLIVPFADCGADNLKRTENLFAKLGYFLAASGAHWAPYIALSKPETVRIPPTPSFVRRGGGMLAAPIIPFDERDAGKVWQSIDADETGRTNGELQFTRMIPEGKPPGNYGDKSWLFVSSDWYDRPQAELFDQIERIFRHRDEPALVPTVLIVDDLGSPNADHELLLSDLTHAGGVVLVPDSQEEIETIRKDPRAFAAAQLVAMLAHSVVTTASSPSVPSSPDAYKEFAKAVTRLSPGAIQDVIEGHRSDDWRYSV